MRAIDANVPGLLRRFGPVGLILAGAACSPQGTPADLASSLKGITKSQFLSCSGPPILEFSQGGQDRMSFQTNLKRGQQIGISNPNTLDSCSVDAVFEQDRLASATFSGNQSMCGLVFTPCLGQGK